MDRWTVVTGAGGVNAGVERVGDGRRFQEWRLNQTACETSFELAKFFEVKNWARIDSKRFLYLLGTDSWARSFDPFTGTDDGRKIVIRGDWADSFVVEINESYDKWHSRETSYEECEHNTGWKIAMPLFFSEFTRNRARQEIDAVTYEEYLSDWLSEGTIYLKEWAPWMRCVRSRTEAKLWLEIGAAPSDALKWIQSGWNTVDALEQIKLLEAQKTLHVAQEVLKEQT